MRSRTALLAMALLMLVAACNGSEEESNELTVNPLDRFVAPGDVATLADGTPVITQGALVIAGDTRLCDALLGQTFPPQCGGDSAVLGDLQRDAVVALNTPPDAQGVAWTTYPLPVRGVVQGGVLVDTEIAGNVYMEMSNGLQVRLMAAQASYLPEQIRTGETIWWAIDATNQTDQPIPMTFSSAQVAEVTIHDGDTEIYRWSNGQTFAQGTQELQFDAGRTAGATLNDQVVLEPGTNLTLRAWITAEGADTVIVTAPIEVVAPAASD
jgi:Intracellular proteinase inhibitor